MKVQAESFHLNGHIIGFRPQTKKLESPYKTPSNTLAVKGLIYMDTPLIRTLSMPPSVSVLSGFHVFLPPGGGALGYFLGGYVPPGTPNWHPVLNKLSAKIDTPF